MNAENRAKSQTLGEAPPLNQDNEGFMASRCYHRDNGNPSACCQTSEPRASSEEDAMAL